MGTVTFAKAKPIWLAGLAEEMNVQAGFRTVFTAGAGTHVLRLTGSTVYRIWFNGEFLGHGPARCGHGYFRIDELELPVRPGENLLAIEVAGYNANSFAYLDQPSFLQAEVEWGGRVRCWSGGSSFDAYRLTTRVQKVQRYSFQRPFVEAYRLSKRSSDWCRKVRWTKKPAPIEVRPTCPLVSRGVPYPLWETRQAVALTAKGRVSPQKNPTLRSGREWSGPRPDFKAFPANKRTLYPSHTMEALAHRVTSTTRRDYSAETAVVLKPDRFQVFDLGTNLTGFIGLRVECDEPTDVFVCFDELAMDDGDVSLTRYGCANVVQYSLKPGRYDLESFEPYTLRFMKVVALKGSTTVSGVHLREYASPESQKAKFSTSDPRLNRLFEAARQTFRQNSTDIFMDCPGRERAGWLCDSFFTARAEQVLCGGNPIERNFLENYQLPKRFPHLTKGMLPMCYPSDHLGGRFIPNWAMWFVIQLREYLQRTGDRGLVESLRPRVYGLIDYFKGLLNDDGLLESLESWVFLEWSKANQFTQDVSYASNMVYAGMLDAAGSLYDDSALLTQAADVRATICDQSFDGDFFVDNAIRREDGVLEVTRNRTETCQYYAFFFDVATPETHPKLWKRLVTRFGPDRDPNTVFRKVYPSNAFIGFFLRLNILSRYGRNDLVLDQLYKDFLPMADRTGTIWEHKDTSASCNHGFASQVAHVLVRDVLGIEIDTVNKRIVWNVPDLPLDWCEARLPVGDDWVDVAWNSSGKTLETTIHVPAGYVVVGPVSN